MLDDAGILTWAVDVYSLGLLLIELLSGLPPLAQYEGPELVAAKRLLPAPEIDRVNLPFEVRSLTMRMLSRDPLRRPTVTEVIQSLVVAEISSFA
jgi:serine/threonine protein kinase